MEGRLILATGFAVLSASSPLSYFELVQRHANLAEKDYWLGRYLLEASTLDLQLQDVSGRMRVSRFLVGRRFSSPGWLKVQQRQFPVGASVAVSGPSPVV